MTARHSDSAPETRGAPGAPTAAPAESVRWSEWACLSELDRLLQGAGLPRGPDRWQNAQDLLTALAAEHRLPADPLQVRPLLAPLFCRSPEEQRRFAEVFDQWLGQGGVRSIGPAVAPVTPAPPPREPPPETPLWPVLLGLGLSVVALALGLYFGLKPPPVGPILPPPPTTTPPVMVESAGSAAYLKLPLEPIPPRSPPELLGPSPQTRRWLAVADWLVPALPGLVLLAGLAWRLLRRRDVLRYRKGDADSPLRHITLASEDDDLFTDPALQAALRRLHTPVRVPTGRLDERATLERTARSLGLFAPVYRELPRVPDLVVLVDFHHRSDHLAGLAETLLARLRAAGIEVHRYPFQRHPARVLGAGGELIALPELAARHSGARLLICGDPSAFMDPWAGRAADWTEVLALWPRRALLTTRPVPQPWLAALARTGLALAPFGEAGLIRLARDLTRAPVASAALPEPILPGRLDTLAANLGAVPEAEDRRALLADLDAWLGPRGGLLLDAAARYPELHSGLTRVLDRALFPADPPTTRAQRLLRLARLPWLRAGHLPRWLRLALVERTERTEARRIGAIYRELLDRASIEGKEALRLPVAVPDRPGTWLVRLRRALRERGWRLDRWIRDLAAQSGPDAALQDRIFLDTLQRPRLLDFLLPRWLARRLPRRPGGAGGAFAVLILALSLGAGLHLAWEGAWMGRPGLRAWAAETAQAAEALSRRGYRIEILHTPATDRLAATLGEVLVQSGFPTPVVVPLPEPAPDDPGPAAATAPPARDRSTPAPPTARPPHAVNSVQIGAEDTVAAGALVAERLQYLAWGDPVVTANRLAAPPPGADPALAGELPPRDLIRVWLTTTGHGGVFTDPLARPLTDTERARFQDPKGLALSEPTPLAPRSFPVFRDRLKDGTEGPAMVKLPGGTFLMGSPGGEPERDGNEGPQHQVSLRPFAIGRAEVSFADYDRFAKATGRQKPSDEGWGRGDRPVINVSWNDATAYAAWVAKQTGQPYRLPSEAEWEYAARAGTQTPFWSGECVHTDQANYDGNFDYNGCGAKTGVRRGKTVPAGSLPANPWGLHEVAGNVWEWVADCWHDTYQGAPSDGSAWGEAGGGDCTRRVVRGGGWDNEPRGLRSADRNRDAAGGANGDLGFRLARTL